MGRAVLVVAGEMHRRSQRTPIRRSRLPVVVLILLALEACGEGSGGAKQASGRAGGRTADTLSSAAVSASSLRPASAYPIYPGARDATELMGSMRAAWVAAGEPAELFDDRLGHRIVWTDDAWEKVREFYRPRATRVLMDHEMEFPEIGRQKMLSGLIQLEDGSIVKFTATRPFFRYPDQLRIDRTVIQLGRLVEARAGVAKLAPARPDTDPAPAVEHVH